MDTNAIRFNLLFDEKNVLNGIRLLGIGHFEEEAFCFSFPFAMQKDKAEVLFEDKKLIFVQKETLEADELPDDADPSNMFFYAYPDSYEVELEPDMAKQLKLLLNAEGPYQDRSYSCEPMLAFGKGFTITAT